MKTTLKIAAAAAALTLSAAAPAYAVPAFTTFGALPQATFGGSGIPNDAVAISTFDINGSTATFGLAATPRFSGGTVTNDGAGTYFAEAGSAVAGPNNTNGALWNLSFFIDLGQETFDDVSVILAYDFDPAVGNEIPIPNNSLGIIPLSLSIPNASTTSLAEGSQNLLFGFFADPTPLGGTAPTPNVFDPAADGDYFIALSAIGSVNGGTPALLGGVAINVVVGEPVTVSEPATLGMLGLSLVAAAGLRRRRA